MNLDQGYYGYTEGELQIVSGADGTVGVQLRQGRTARPKRRYGVNPDLNAYTHCQRKGCGRPITVWLGDHARGRGKYCSLRCRYDETPACKTAILQAMRYELRMDRQAVAQAMQMSPDAVSGIMYMATIPWFERRYQAEAIAAAQAILEGRNDAQSV